MPDSRVTATGLAFSYGRGPQVLAGLDFSAGPCEVVGLLGRNGSGKTTLLRLLAGLLRPGQGLISVSPHPAVVLDRTPFQEALTGAENFRLTAALRGQANQPSAQTEWFSALDLTSAARRPVAEYSLGMRRRLALAEALSAGTNLSLFDEPTLGLDPDGRAALAGLLATAAKAGGTIVLATNDASFAERACTRVLLLESGEVVADGSPSVLIHELNAPTVMDIEFDGESSPTPPPAGFDIVSSLPGRLVLSGTGGAARLPELSSWLAAADTNVTAIRIREPDLGDVFQSLTGHTLETASEDRT